MKEFWISNCTLCVQVLLQSPDDDMDYADAQFKKGFAVLDYFKEKPSKQDKETKDLEYLKELSKI